MNISNDAAVAAIKFAITNEAGSEAVTFLDLWLHGEFDRIRRDWDNVPNAVFIGADPLLYTSPPSPKAEKAGSVKIPSSVDEAELMAKLGMLWLEQNAPERLKKDVTPLEAKLIGTVTREATGFGGVSTTIAFNAPIHDIPVGTKLYASLPAYSRRIGKWLSAALDDPKVCDEMKADIREWFGDDDHGPEFSDGCDSEGFRGGCERMGHTVGTCNANVVYQLLNKGQWEDIDKDRYDCWIKLNRPDVVRKLYLDQHCPDASWLWIQLMDWCRVRKVHPGDYNDLFNIIGKAREFNASGLRPHHEFMKDQ